MIKQIDPDPSKGPARDSAGPPRSDVDEQPRWQSHKLLIPTWLADVLVCLGLAGVGLWFVLNALPMPPGRTLIGVGTFPKIIGMLLIALCLFQASLSVIGHKRGSNVVIYWPVMVGLGVALVLLFPTAMERFGYFLTAAIWVPAFAWVAGIREIGTLVMVTAAVLALARFVFQGLLGTPLI